MAKLICAIVLACLGLSVSAFFGGGCRGGLGFGNIFNNLTAAQQQQLRQIFQNGKNETKGTIRSRIDAFALTLSPALQVCLVEK
jgi:Spy/CpxP family protein refolding chaperone